MDALDWLNKYSNLLLVIITATYVWLTAKTLIALQRSSLREREMRHLDDIKQHVIRSLVQWIDEVERRLRGLTPPVQVRTTAIPRPQAALGEFAYEYKSSLEQTLGDPGAVSNALFSHARDLHFPAELKEFQAFETAVLAFASKCALVARNCADRSAHCTSLPRAMCNDPTKECGDSDTLIEICVRDVFLRHPNAQIGFNTLAAGVLEVRDAYAGRTIGRGPSEAVRVWVDNSVARFQDEWTKNGIMEEAKEFLESAARVRRTLEGLEFTYNLPGNCSYIGND